MSVTNEDTEVLVQTEKNINNSLDDITTASSSLKPPSSIDEKASLTENQESGRTRKPFHFRNTLINSTPTAVPVIPTDDQVPSDAEEEATYSRFKYYQRLRGAPKEDSALVIPDHVVPGIFWHPFIPGRPTTPGRQSSIVTIFAVWNTMMGSSILAMPWAIEQAGLLAGIMIILGMSAVCFYTAYCLLKVFGIYSEKENLPDLPDLCQFLLGTYGRMVSIVFSALSLLGASAVYWVLMSNFLFHTGQYVYDLDTAGNSSLLMPMELEENNTFNLLCPKRSVNLTTLMTVEEDIASESTFDAIWNLNLTVPLYLAVLLFPLICFKSATFFTKFNALGTISVFYIMTFVVTKGSSWGMNVEFFDETSPFFIPLVQPDFPALTGMLALALFLHNCVVSIMKSNENQSNNARDLFIAYILVACTYLTIGATFYMTFPLEKDCIEDNLLNNFARSDMMTAVARVFLLFQMTTVFPLLTFILRTQILHAVFGSIYPSFFHVVGLNALLLTICISVAIFLPEVGTITRFSGAVCGLVYIFALPSVLYITSIRKENNGKVPITTYALHSAIILGGVANLIAQFVI